MFYFLLSFLLLLKRKTSPEFCSGEVFFLYLPLIFYMVRMGGFEPPWGEPHKILSLARLPIPPHPQNFTLSSIYFKPLPHGLSITLFWIPSNRCRDIFYSERMCENTKLFSNSYFTLFLQFSNAQ